MKKENILKMKAPFIAFIVAAMASSSYANDTLVLLGKDSTLRADQISSAFYPNFGVQYSNYSEGINAFLGDHACPTFELEVGIGGGKLVGYFSPWMTNPETKMLVWNDTLYPYEKFNPIKAGLMLGKRQKPRFPCPLPLASRLESITDET
jgi:hypothetical protein